MDTLSVTVVVHMTGLLLLTPARPNGTGPMHVLMPAPTHLPSHVAWMAYPADSVASAGRCSYYGKGLCFLDMDGWTIDLGNRLGQEPHHVRRNEIVNLTTSAEKRPRVRKKYLSDEPGRRVRSRVRLLNGEVINTCSLAEWQYDDLDPTTPARLPLANLVTWRIPPVSGEVVIRRERLDEDDNAPEVLPTPTPASGSVEILILHIPAEEAVAYLKELLAESDLTATGNTAPGGAAHLPHSRPAGPATHFNAYYDLLHAGHAGKERPLPHQPRESPVCTLRMQNLAMSRFIRGLETVNCMVAAALPRG